MNPSADDFPGRFVEWESKSALLAHLDGRTSRTVVIGLDAEAPRRFFSLEIGSETKTSEIGILLSWHGVMPAAVKLGSGLRLLVGHDASITWIDLESLSVACTRRLPGVFFEFASLGDDDEIVVLHELGALRVDAAGSVRWSVDTEVVESSRINEDGALVLTIMDAPEVVVDLATGAVAND